MFPYQCTEFRCSYNCKWAYEGLKTDNAMNRICERQVDSWNDVLL